MKTKIPKNPKSEAALKWCVENWMDIRSIRSLTSSPIVYFYYGLTCVALIDLRALIRKRQPLTGVKKQLADIVRGKKKVVKNKPTKKVKR